MIAGTNSIAAESMPCFVSALWLGLCCARMACIDVSDWHLQIAFALRKRRPQLSQVILAGEVIYQTGSY